MALKITQVDAFTNKPFGGNPAAVCILPEPAEAVWSGLDGVSARVWLIGCRHWKRPGEGYWNVWARSQEMYPPRKGDIQRIRSVAYAG